MMTFDESFLDAWLRLAATMGNVSVSGGVTRNEALVCHALYQRQKERPGATMTPTELSQATLIRRSQINRDLNKLEEMGIVTRERAAEDRRQVNVTLNLNNAGAYLEEREQVLALTHQAVEQLGQERAEQALEMMNEVTSLAVERFPLDDE